MSTDARLVYVATCVSQVRIMFEVQDLRYATLATVSRCGMVWFSEDVLSVDMMCENFMQRLRNVPVEEGEEDVTVTARARGAEADEDLPASLHVCFIMIAYRTWTLFMCMQSSLSIQSPLCMH